MPIDPFAVLKEKQVELGDELIKQIDALAKNYGPVEMKLGRTLANIQMFLDVLKTHGADPQLLRMIFVQFATVSSMVVRATQVNVETIAQIATIIRGYSDTVSDELAQEFEKLTKDKPQQEQQDGTATK